MEYLDFEKHLSTIANAWQNMQEIDDFLYEHDMEITYPTLLDEAVSLLEMLSGDKWECIRYWLYELNCGKDWKEGTVEDKNGNDIPYATIKDVWNDIQTAKGANR